MNYRIISTGSKGNSLYIDHGFKILIDIGVPYAAIKGLNIDLVFLTHVHSDHLRISTLRRLVLNHPTVKVVAPPYLYFKLIQSGIPKRNIVIATRDIEKVQIKTNSKLLVAKCFSLHHDVPNVGWTMDMQSEAGEKVSILYATDTSSMSHIKYPSLDYYFLEANYEDSEIEKRIAEKISKGEYSYELRAREQHLSKEKADIWLADNAGENSVFVYMHRHEGREDITEGV